MKRLLVIFAVLAALGCSSAVAGGGVFGGGRGRGGVGNLFGFNRGGYGAGFRNDFRFRQPLILRVPVPVSFDVPCDPAAFGYGADGGCFGGGVLPRDRFINGRFFRGGFGLR